MTFPEYSVLQILHFHPVARNEKGRSAVCARR